MNPQPDTDLVLEVAAELATQPAFIEKDWHVTRVLHALSQVSWDHVDLLFGGGTSLSKGYGLLQRFSEDIDLRFAARAGATLTVGRRKRIRHEIIDVLSAIQGLSVVQDKIEVHDGRRFVRIPVAYEAEFEAEGIRPYVLVELSFSDVAPATEHRDLGALIAEEGDPTFQMACVAPIETAADKIGALSWRIVQRDRCDRPYEATTIRHLHDLYHLVDWCHQEPAFPHLVDAALQDGLQRLPPELRGEYSDGPSRLEFALRELAGDPRYAEEYEQFVGGVSWAADDDRIGFEEALGTVRELIQRLGAT